MKIDLTQRLQACCERFWRWDGSWWGVLGLLTAAALGSRLVALEYPPGTTWDEVHFGGFGNKYLNRTFFHDVHPPLGKMLVAGAMKMAGFDPSSFSFATNTFYPGHLHYAALRGIFGVTGACMVPLAFITVWHLTSSLPASALAAITVLSDHFVHRISTLVLLDGPLLVAILASVCASFRFHATSCRDWSVGWWTQLSATGACLGVVMSIKYIGVFTVVFVGLHTAYQLCCIVVDPRRPWWETVRHVGARALCLIVLPVALYLAAFVVHFSLLTHWEPHAGAFYHSRFVASMRNTEYDNKVFPKYLDYGANISVKSSTAMGGLLESWYELFPSHLTAACQQVTLTTLSDLDAVTWTVRFVNVSQNQVEDALGPGGVRVVRSGDHVVLTHPETGRSLRSHGHRAPVTRRHYQVCGYGDDFEVGPFETWQILIPGAAPGTPVAPLSSEFMLKHYMMGCYLANPNNTPLPADWAFDTSKEVTCTKNVLSSGLLWHVSWVNSTRLAATEQPSGLAMGLWEKVVEQHKAMVLGNQGLKPKPQELLQSARPWMWPLMYRLQVLAVYDRDRFTEHMHRALLSSNSTSSDDSSPSLTSDAMGANNTAPFSSASSTSLSVTEMANVVKLNSDANSNAPTQSESDNSHTTLRNCMAFGSSSEASSSGSSTGSSGAEASDSFARDSHSCAANSDSDPGKIPSSVSSLKTAHLNNDSNSTSRNNSNLKLENSNPKILNLNSHNSEFSRLENSRSRSANNSDSASPPHSDSSVLGNLDLGSRKNSDSSSPQKWNSSNESNITSLPLANDIGIASLPTKPTKRNKSGPEIYAIFLHNPVLAYTNLVSVVLAVLLMVYHLYVSLRGSQESPQTYARRKRTVAASAWLLACWAVHYLPFFFMSRILYVHHYCPAYLYSCMLTGVVLSHLCECTAARLQPQRPELLMSALLSVPALAFLLSYCALFPFATYIEGKFSLPHPQLNKYLDFLRLGQQWVEFGYDIGAYEQVWTTSMLPVDELSWQNEDVNASLYYTTPLDTQPARSPRVDPVAASNYSAWKMENFVTAL